jgi:hypothetical protein
MKQESSAVIKLTKSEIEMVINALQFTEEAAEHFDVDTMFTHKTRLYSNKVRHNTRRKRN